MTPELHSCAFIQHALQFPKQGDCLDDTRHHQNIPPTPERVARKDVVDQEGKRGGRQFKSIACPLEFYEARSWITEQQYEAGKRFHYLWWSGCMRSPFVQWRYQESQGGLRFCYPLGAFATAYNAALQAIDGNKGKAAVYQVCCEERAVGRGNMITLKYALEDLIKHFEL